MVWQPLSHDLAALDLELWHYIAFSAVILLGMELLSWIVLRGFSAAPRIVMKAKHLDALELKVQYMSHWDGELDGISKGGE